VIQSVAFASCYVCSPNGTGTVCERSRLLRALLKAGNADFILKYALRVHQQAADSPALADFFDSKDVLVPVPRSAPNGADRLWPAGHLAAALVGAGVGGSTWPGLRRIREVNRSATAAAGRRPTVNSHYESFLMERPAVPPERVLLVDDVVTRGRTLLAAASCVQDAIPLAQVRAFALVRTLGFIPQVERLLDPCKGEIRWRHGDAYRFP
jgi:predicted amidophosphoribosyltransferase